MKRSEFLCTLTAGSCTLALPACGLLDEPEKRLCALHEAEKQGFFRGAFNGHAVFFTRIPGKSASQPGEWVAFALTCRHKRATVEWKADETEFICPKHKGRYNAQGDAIDGPPHAPLHRFQYELRNGDVWLLNAWVSEG